MTTFALTVIPGYTFPVGVPVTLTADILNKLGKPTVNYTGTISAASISGLTTTQFDPALISGLSAASGNASNVFLTWDVTNNAYRKTSLSAVGAQALGSLTSYGAAIPPLTDTVPIVESGTNYSVALSWFMGGLISGQSALAVAVDPSADLMLLWSNATASPHHVKATIPPIVRSVTESVVTTAGTSTAYTYTSGSGLVRAALADGQRIIARIHTANGAAPTLAVDGLSAVAIQRGDGTVPYAGELVSGQVVELVYSNAATAWQVLGLRSGAAGVFAYGKVATGAGNTSLGGAVASNIFTVTGHGLVAGDWIWTTSPGSVFASAYVPYYVISTNLTANTFSVSATLGGGIATITDQTLHYILGRKKSTTFLSGSGFSALVDRADLSGGVGFQLFFLAAAASANYSIQITGSYEPSRTGGVQNYSPYSGTYQPTTGGFLFIGFDQGYAPAWVSVMCLN
jgi:hypothetical protein